MIPAGFHDLRPSQVSLNGLKHAFFHAVRTVGLFRVTARSHHLHGQVMRGRDPSFCWDERNVAEVRGDQAQERAVAWGLYAAMLRKLVKERGRA